MKEISESPCANSFSRNVYKIPNVFMILNTVPLHNIDVRHTTHPHPPSGAVKSPLGFFSSPFSKSFLRGFFNSCKSELIECLLILSIFKSSNFCNTYVTEKKRVICILLMLLSLFCTFMKTSKGGTPIFL